MKKFLFIFLSTAMLVLFSNGCTEDFEEINTNDKVLAELDPATIGNVYGYCQYNALMIQYYFSQNIYGDHYAQYFANTKPTFPWDRYNLGGGVLEATWKNYYRN